MRSESSVIRRAALPVLAVLSFAAVVRAADPTIANPQNLNALEWYGNKVGNSTGLLTQITATENQSLARYTCDGGMSLWGNASAGAKLRYAMPEAILIENFYIYWGTYSSHYAKSFTIRYSETNDWTSPGWSSEPYIQETNWPGPSGTPYATNITPAMIKYVELTVSAAGSSGYIQVGEFMLLPPSSATILSNGRNILADAYASTSQSVTDGRVWSNSKSPFNCIPNTNNPPPYWQVDFGVVRPINVVTFSTYPGQNFSTASIYVSTNGADFGSAVWTGANVVDFREVVFPTVQARYVRITPSADWSAMHDIHVFYVRPRSQGTVVVIR